MIDHHTIISRCRPTLMSSFKVFCYRYVTFPNFNFIFRYSNAHMVWKDAIWCHPYCDFNSSIGRRTRGGSFDAVPAGADRRRRSFLIHLPADDRASAVSAVCGDAAVLRWDGSVRSVSVIAPFEAARVAREQWVRQQVVQNVVQLRLFHGRLQRQRTSTRRCHCRTLNVTAGSTHRHRCWCGYWLSLSAADRAAVTANLSNLLCHIKQISLSWPSSQHILTVEISLSRD